MVEKPKKCNKTLIESMLIIAYRKAVKNRYKKYILVRVNNNLVKNVAGVLNDVKLVNLFVKSQFHFLTVDFCKKNFGTVYPPSNVVFGGNCFERYEKYLERGVNDGS